LKLGRSKPGDRSFMEVMDKFEAVASFVNRILESQTRNISFFQVRYDLSGC
jgi:hypothetical protein